ncbi:hypothetical protein EJK50_1796 [Moraxella catarrhalis]|nr:hypothetical protein EJK50_1796 [Moraxella catarrhalis]
MQSLGKHRSWRCMAEYSLLMFWHEFKMWKKPHLKLCIVSQSNFK